MQDKLKSVATVKSLHKAGKCEFDSKFGLISLEVKRLRGNENYETYVDGRKTGILAATPIEAWEKLGIYLGVGIVEGEAK